MTSSSIACLRAYRSIFLDDGWAHQKYYGWSLAEDRPGLRILKKKWFGFTRSLMLLTPGGEAWLDDAVARSCGRTGRADVVVHDFDDVLSGPPVLAGRRFRPAGTRERLLNIATFAIDLTLDEADILDRMSADYRRKIRKAESLGVVVEAHESPNAELRDRFVDVFRKFARERSIDPIDRGVLSRMYSGGDAILFLAQKGGALSGYLHVYIAGNAAIFLHGVNLSKENDGVGQYSHWRAIQCLKQKGLGWYDLGGVASQDPTDGIYNFKARFGAPLTSLGTEWRCMGGVLRSVWTSRKLVRRGAELIKSR